MSAEVQTSMATDAVIRRAIHDELEWIPEVDASSITVAVDSGIATLAGSVSTHGEKVAARDAAWRVRGVTAVIDELVVDTEAPAPPSDEELAKAARHILELDGRVPAETITVTADHAVITLGGTVDWNYQRECARHAAESLAGVRYVDSRIELTSRLNAGDAEKRIREAIERNAELDSSRVSVEVDGDKALLTGTVRSIAARRQAEEAAWCSPQIATVENRLRVDAA